MTSPWAGRRDELARSLSEVKSLSQENIEKLLHAAEHMHNVYLLGSPGVGKTMIARRIASALGGVFRAPHHTISTSGMRGGRSAHAIYLGEIGRAQGGTLFLDEAPEFSRQTLDAVSHAYQEGYFSIAQGGEIFNVHYPQGAGGFRLILASNPCPCGCRQPTCKCNEAQISNYLARIQPLRDLCETQLNLSAGEQGEPRLGSSP